MALNSHTKRRAATALPWHVIPPVPDNSIDVADRFHIAGYYRIAPSALPIFARLYDEHSTHGRTFDQPTTNFRTFDKPTTQSRTHDY